METEIKDLMKLTNRTIAQEVQHLLEEHGIYSLIESDHPASSLMAVYSRMNVIEDLVVKVHRDDEMGARSVIVAGGYEEYLLK